MITLPEIILLGVVPLMIFRLCKRTVKKLLKKSERVSFL